VINCVNDSYLFSIPDLKGVAGVLASEERNIVFTSNRGENTVAMIKAGLEPEVAKVRVGIRPNGLAFDPARNRLLVANTGDPRVEGSTTVTIVDVAKREVVCDIPAPGRTRWAIYDRLTDSFYVNIMEPPQVAVIDGGNPVKVGRTFPVPAKGPHGLELDSRHKRLYCACDEGKLVTLDTSSGTVGGGSSLSGAPDAVFFNRDLHHLYVAVGDPGVIDVIDTDALERVQTQSTEQGAHTIAFDPKRNKVYAFLPSTHRAFIFEDAVKE